MRSCSNLHWHTGEDVNLRGIQDIGRCVQVKKAYKEDCKIKTYKVKTSAPIEGESSCDHFNCAYLDPPGSAIQLELQANVESNTDIKKNT